MLGAAMLGAAMLGGAAMRVGGSMSEVILTRDEAVGVIRVDGMAPTGSIA